MTWTDRRTAFAETHDVSEESAGRMLFYLLLRAVHERAGLPTDGEMSAAVEAGLPRLPDHEFDADEVERYVSEPATLADAYAETMTREVRRENGQFFTPRRVARYMARWLPADAERVLDPGTGTGVFARAAGERSDAAVTGIDADPLMVLAARTSCALAGTPATFEARLGDFLSDDDPADERYDAVLCNPPYNRFQAYDNGVVAEIEDAHGVDLGGFSNIYPLFFLRGAERVRDGGRLIFVTPAEFLDTGFGEGLKRHLRSEFEIEALIRLNWDGGVFDALTTALVTVLRVGGTTESVPFVESSDPETFDDLPATAAELREIDLDGVAVRSVEAARLRPAEKWSRYFRDPVDTSYLSATVPLVELAETKRGIATGCNDFFTLTAEEIDRWGIEEEFYTPVLSKAAQAPHYTLTEADLAALREAGKNVSLLWVTDEPSAAVRDYLEHGKSEYEAHERYLTSNRDPWYAPERRRPAPILATVFSRGNMRFVENRTDARNLASFHAVYPEFDDDRRRRALLGYLNSETALELATLRQRQYADGLGKFEPGDLDDLPTLDIRRLGDEDIARLADGFERLDAAERADDESRLDAARDDLDATVRELLADRRERGRRESLSYWADE